MKMIPFNEWQKQHLDVDVIQEPSPVEVGIFPHKMLEWEEFNGMSSMSAGTLSYILTLGLTRPHPELKDTCYLTCRHTFRIMMNRRESFRAVGETVYRIAFRQHKVTEYMLLSLVKHSHEWFAQEFESRKKEKGFELKENPCFNVREVIQSVRESMQLAGYR